jgi:L-serine dehydratase
LALSVFDMFSIGIGPSSSHTVGPMRAAYRFVTGLQEDNLLNRTSRIRAELYGSLGATGIGHGSDKAVLLGLEGETPDCVDIETVQERIVAIEKNEKIMLNGVEPIKFKRDEDLIFFRRQTLPAHPNGMTFYAYDANGNEVKQSTYYSVGGGFIVSGDVNPNDPIVEDKTELKYPFTSGAQLLEHCKIQGISISTLMMENEKSWRSEDDIRSGLLHIWRAMEACVKRGCESEGILPGGLKVQRRAPSLYQKLTSEQGKSKDPLYVMDWVNLYALAVNEENAAGGRVVTAPTNGAAGIIPAVAHYYQTFYHQADDDGIVRYLLTAAAIGILYKINASISGAEVGCQGEVGVACSMAAGALTEVLGGTPEQVENAAEIGMEHNLGLTCDPIGGLVQVPCIERNAMGAVKAINAQRLAMRGDGTHKVSLDKVIRTMRQTGADMNNKYKETARGGLAVNIIEC